MQSLKEIFYLGYWRTLKPEAVIREDDNILIVDASCYAPEPAVPIAPAIAPDLAEPRQMNNVVRFYKSNPNYYRESFDAFVIMNINTGTLARGGKVYFDVCECELDLTDAVPNNKIFKLVQCKGTPKSPNHSDY